MGGFLIQVLGFAGMAAYAISYQFRSNRTLFLIQTLGSLLFCLQFALMGQLTGSVNLLLIIVRNLLVAGEGRLPIARRDWWKWALVATSLAALPLTWRGPVSLLPLAAFASSTLAYWENDARLLRLANLACACPCWLVYDVLIGSWGGVANEAIALASIVVSMRRLDLAGPGDGSGRRASR